MLPFENISLKQFSLNSPKTRKKLTKVGLRNCRLIFVREMVEIGRVNKAGEKTQKSLHQRELDARLPLNFSFTDEDTRSFCGQCR